MLQENTKAVSTKRYIEAHEEIEVNKPIMYEYIEDKKRRNEGDEKIHQKATVLRITVPSQASHFYFFPSQASRLSPFPYLA